MIMDGESVHHAENRQGDHRRQERPALLVAPEGTAGDQEHYVQLGCS